MADGPANAPVVGLVVPANGAPSEVPLSDLSRRLLEAGIDDVRAGRVSPVPPDVVPPPGACPIDGCDEPVHHWFGLTYSSYFTVQRSVLEAMPVDWQARFVALLEEMREAVDTDKVPGEFWVRAKEKGRFIKDPYADYRRGPAPPMRAKGGG